MDLSTIKTVFKIDKIRRVPFSFWVSTKFVALMIGFFTVGLMFAGWQKSTLCVTAGQSGLLNDQQATAACEATGTRLYGLQGPDNNRSLQMPRDPVIQPGIPRRSFQQVDLFGQLSPPSRFFLDTGKNTDFTLTLYKSFTWVYFYLWVLAFGFFTPYIYVVNASHRKYANTLKTIETRLHMATCDPTEAALQVADYVAETIGYNRSFGLIQIKATLMGLVHSLLQFVVFNEMTFWTFFKADMITLWKVDFAKDAVYSDLYIAFPTHTICQSRFYDVDGSLNNAEYVCIHPMNTLFQLMCFPLFLFITIATVIFTFRFLPMFAMMYLPSTRFTFLLKIRQISAGGIPQQHLELIAGKIDWSDALFLQLVKMYTPRHAYWVIMKELPRSIIQAKIKNPFFDV